MANWDITAFGSALEFDTSNGELNFGCRVDDTHVLNFWEGNSSAFAQVFSVNKSTGAMTAIGSPLNIGGATFFEGGSAIQIDGSHYLVSWLGASNKSAGVQVFEVNLSTWAVSALGSRLALSGASSGGYSSVAHLQGTKYVVSFFDSTRAFLTMVDVNGSTWAVTSAGSNFDKGNGSGTSGESRNFEVRRISNTRFILFWAGSGSDGFVQTFSVNESTWAITAVGSELEFDTSNGTHLSVGQIDDLNYICAWTGAGGDGFVQTFTVNPSTFAVTANGTALEFDTSDGTHNSITKIDDTHYANGWTGSGSDGFTQVFEVNPSTMAVSAVGTRLEFDTSDGTFIHTQYMGGGVLVIFWTGPGSDGFVRSFQVEGVTEDVEEVAEPGAYALEYSIPSPTALAEREAVVFASPVQLECAIPTPTVTVEREVVAQAAPVALVYSIPGPTVVTEYETLATASPAQLAYTIPSPAVHVERETVAVASPQVLEYAIPSPTVAVEAETVAEPAAYTLEYTIPAPAVSMEREVMVEVQPVTLAHVIPAPTVTHVYETAATPSPTAMAYTIPGPTVITEQGEVVNVGPYVLEYTIPAPTVSIEVEVVVTPNVVVLEYTIPATTAVAERDVVVEVPPVQLIYTAPSPTVTAWRDAVANPAAYTLAYTVTSPVVTAEGGGGGAVKDIIGMGIIPFSR